jgi:beta-glucanase (GH16 family)
MLAETRLSRTIPEAYDEVVRKRLPRTLGAGALILLLVVAVIRLRGDDDSVEHLPRPAALQLIHDVQGGCGGRAAVAWAGGTWRCTFSDDFDRSALDLTKWDVTQTGHTGFRFGGECYLKDDDNVGVRGGRLDLTVRRVAPFTCQSPADRFRTRYTGGMVTTAKRFDQTYGRFEVRARFLAGTAPGLHSAIWLWPSRPAYGAWPHSGEIDIAELYTRYPDRVIPYVHYASSGPDRTVTNTRCRVKTPEQFHTYAAEWTPGAITITFDGLVCVRTGWDRAAPLTGSAPFDRPFHLNLTQALGIGQNAFDPATTPLPASMQVDYVHVWG